MFLATSAPDFATLCVNFLRRQKKPEIHFLTSLPKLYVICTLRLRALAVKQFSEHFKNRKKPEIYKN